VKTNELQLFAPESYHLASKEVRDRVTNGCGTAGWKGWLVPDTVYFLSIKAACQIHDWMYAAGTTLADKEEADRVFLNNMMRIINAAGGWGILVQARRTRAREYYEAVKYCGGPAFWDGKNKAENLPVKEDADASCTVLLQEA
jgi:hypothetical protein